MLYNIRICSAMVVKEKHSVTIKFFKLVCNAVVSTFPIKCKKTSMYTNIKTKGAQHLNVCIN